MRMVGANGRSRWTDALLDRMRQLGDPVADTPVAAVLGRSGVDAVNAVMRTLVRVDQPLPEKLPDELKAYLVESQPLPDWADMRRIKRGQQLFETWGVLIVLCLFCASLPSSYAAAKGVKVLHLTARFDTDTRRRAMETGQFLIDALTVGGLDEHGTGRRTIQRVRLMHGAVRHLILARNGQQPGLWNPDWGTPINQEDLAGTLLAFSGVVVEPMVRLGVQLSAADVDAYLHVWNVIGHLLGVRDELLVRDVADAAALVDAIRRRHFKASPEGQELTRALLELLDELTPFQRFDDTIPPLIRHLIGDETADMLGVPQSDLFGHLGRPERIANWFVVHLLGEIEHDLPRYQLMSRIAHPFGRDLLRGLFRLERGGERAPFNIPDHLARSWELPA
jgi:ER-bound oxygenase mpaB/B'/Rubber oxygenase, catalytic domain